MDKIGLIGGMTPESTILYYQILNRLVSEKFGGLHSAKVVINSLDFGLISNHQANGEWDKLNEIIAEAAQTLERAGAKCILIGANTMHLCFDYAQSKVNIPIIHIAEATSKSIRDQQIAKVGLLGTKYTMEKDFYKSILSKNGINFIIPSSSERQLVHDVIYNELAKGIMNDASRDIYVKVIENLKERGAEGIILGCTEIPLLIQQKDVSIPVFDTTEIHAKSAINFVFKTPKT